MDRIPYVPQLRPGDDLPILHDYDDGLSAMFAPAATEPAHQTDDDD